MRRITMFNHVSADGFFATEDGRLDWIVPDDELDRAAVARMDGTDTMLLGRRTYQMFESFWPKAADASSAADPHSEGRRSPELAAIAHWINASTKVVFSRTLMDVRWQHSRLVCEFDPIEIVEMKAQPGKDIIVFGSGSIVSQLTRHGLIDEYQFVVNPRLLGRGRPLLGELSRRTSLEFLEARPYASGLVMLRYAIAG